MTITQNVRRKEKAKRKYTRINERVSEEVTLTLKVAPEYYRNCASLETALRPGEWQGLRITRVLAREGLVRVSCETAEALRRTDRTGTHHSQWDSLADGDTALRLFLYVYGQLENCRIPGAAA